MQGLQGWREGFVPLFDVVNDAIDRRRSPLARMPTSLNGCGVAGRPRPFLDRRAQLCHRGTLGTPRQNRPSSWTRGRASEILSRPLSLPSWEAAVAEDWLGKWAMNQMLINVSTRKFARSVRLPEGDVPAPMWSGLSKSAASRPFVALSAARMKEWVASDLPGLDLLVIQIDGIHMDEDLILVADRHGQLDHLLCRWR
jgi:hypothetical protein